MAKSCMIKDFFGSNTCKKILNKFQNFSNNLKIKTNIDCETYSIRSNEKSMHSNIDTADQLQQMELSDLDLTQSIEMLFAFVEGEHGLAKDKLNDPTYRMLKNHIN